MVYKEVLQVRPRTLLTINYQNYNDTFVLCQHNQSTGHKKKRLLSMGLVRESLPHA